MLASSTSVKHFLARNQEIQDSLLRQYSSVGLLGLQRKIKQVLAEIAFLIATN